MMTSLSFLEYRGEASHTPCLWGTRREEREGGGERRQKEERGRREDDDENDSVNEKRGGERQI